MTPENGRQAYAAIRQARALATSRDPRERALIEALLLRFAADRHGDRAALDRAYAGGDGRGRRPFRSDPDVQTLYADARDEHDAVGLLAEGRLAEARDGDASSPTLERVIARASRTPGSAPLLHPRHRSVGQSGSRASASADVLGSLMPAAGHIVHMPAHIYLRVGRYADAAEANVRAIAADQDYLAQCQAQGLYPVSYYPHNLHFLWAAATLEGRNAVAIDAARQVAEKVPHHHAGALAWTADFPVTPLAGLRAFRHVDGDADRAEAARDRALRHGHLALRSRCRVRRARPTSIARRKSGALDALAAHEAFTTTLKDTAAR